MREEKGSYHHGDLRSALLLEAARMISEDGAASVTMRAIGERLGVSRAAPYRHFPDKAALLAAVAAAGFARLGERIRAVGTPSASDGADRLRAMGEAYVRFALDNPGHYRLMYGKEALTRADRPELRDAANDLFEAFVGAIEAYQRAGVIAPGEARSQAYVAWSAVHGLGSLLIEGQIRADVDVDALIRSATATLLDGMRPRP